MSLSRAEQRSESALEPLPHTASPAECAVITRQPVAAPRVSRRAMLLGVVLMVANGFLVFHAEAVRGARVTFAVPFANVLFLLTVLTAINAWLTRRAPRLALTSVELLMLYVILSVQTAVSSGFFIHWILRSITHGFWFDSPETGNATKFGPLLPGWFTVQDRQVLRGFYLGNSTLFTHARLAAWLGPIVAWTLFCVGLGVVFMAVASLFSRQWIHHERLTYPVVELPFQMVASREAFWRQRLLWIGFSLAAGIELLNGLNYWFPSLPAVPVKVTDVAPFITAKPWDGLRELNVSFYPFILGICYLAPVDLCFSAVFFYMIIKAEEIFGRMFALDMNPQYPFWWEQGIGAGLAILFVLLLGSRAHLKEVWRRAFNRAAGMEDPAEARLYRSNLLTIAAGSLLLVLWLVAAGLWWWAAVFLVFIYCGIGLVAARIRAESGFPHHLLDDMGGTTLLMAGVGGNALGLRNISILGLLNGFTKFNTYHMMPHQVEGFRIADRVGLGRGGMGRMILLAIVVSVPVTLLIDISSFYHLGASAKADWGLFLGRDSWQWTLPRWTSGNAEAVGVAGGRPNWPSLGLVGGSFVFCIVLMSLRYRFLWFPLHPVGLVMGNGMRAIWSVVLIAALLKWLTVRYTGLRGYRAALPFFFGLILGEILTGMMWIVVGIVLNTPTYVFFP